MKKIFALFLTLIMLLPLVACAGADNKPTEHTEPVTEATQAPTQEPTQAPTVCSHNFKDGYCTLCKTRDESYPFEFVEFKDRMMEMYVKQVLNLAPEYQVATIDMETLTTFIVEERISDVEPLKYAKNLKEITITESNVQNLSALAELPITKVQLGRRDGITEIDVSFMKDLKEVTTVHFYECRLTGGSMEDVVSSPKLTDYFYISSYMRNETDGNIDYLAGAKNLEEMDLWIDFETDTDLSVLTSLTKLERLNIRISNSLENFSTEQYNVLKGLYDRGVSVDVT